MDLPAPVIAAHEIINKQDDFKKSPRAMLQGMVLIDDTIDDLENCEALPEILLLDYLAFLKPIREALSASWIALSAK